MRILLLLVLLAPILCTLGVDVSQHFATSTYQCIKNAGYHFISIRGFCSNGVVDSNIVSNLNNARAAGFTPDIYMFPCRGKSATSQVDTMISAISSNLYGKVWIDVETNPSPGCGWGSDHTTNCNFLTELVDRVKHHGKSVGIYASKYMWQGIMGSFTACPALGSEDLWYAHYDNNPSFSDFSSFGGWKTPHVKQFQGTSTLCGAGVDKNYKP
jgi:GH25 family lysozyme M1 (1,4-beta-N-acetylmuramidase)